MEELEELYGPRMASIILTAIKDAISRSDHFIVLNTQNYQLTNFT